MQPTILFEDHHYLAVHKPAGLSTQAPPGIDSLEGWAKQYLKEKYAKPGGVYLGIPHRLDRPVSGVVLFARNTKAASRVALQFQQHTIGKQYLAVITQPCTENQGIWVDWLLKLAGQARVEKVTPEEPGAKEAITGYRVRASKGRFTLLELTPRTGRTHQLRVALASRGIPILGDLLYGSIESYGPTASDPRLQAIGLHAHTLTFEHPFRKEPVTIVAPASNEMLKLVEDGA